MLVGQFWETYEIGKHSSPPHLIDSNKDDDECNNNADDADKGYGQDNDLVGHGVPSRHFCRKRKRDSFEEDRNIHRALPKMDNPLSNWTLHGQNLGKMLRNYKRQYRNLPSDH